MKQIHKIIALVSVPFLLIGCGTEQTTTPDPEPLVINTVEDGKAYGIIYLNEEVLQ